MHRSFVLDISALPTFRVKHYKNVRETSGFKFYLSDNFTQSSLPQNKGWNHIRFQTSDPKGAHNGPRYLCCRFKPFMNIFAKDEINSDKWFQHIRFTYRNTYYIDWYGYMDSFHLERVPVLSCHSNYNLREYCRSHTGMLIPCVIHIDFIGRCSCN